MKKLITILAVLLWASVGWGADWYALKVGGTTWKVRSGSLPDANNGTACDDINGAIFVAKGDSNVLVLPAGTYTTADLDASDGIDTSAILSIREFLPTDPGYSIYAGDVILSGDGLVDHLFVVNSGGQITVTGIEFKNSAPTYFEINVGGGGSLTLEKCILSGGVLGFNAAGTLRINNSQILNHSSFLGDINTGTATLTRNIIKNNSGALRVLAGSYAGSHNVFVGNGNGAIAISADNAQTAVETNSIFLANSHINMTIPILKNVSSNGTGTAINCFLTVAPLSKDTTTTGWTLTNCTTDKHPGTLSNRREAMVSITFDDWWETPAAIPVAALCDVSGHKITWTLPSEYLYSAERAEDAASLLANGHELCLHSANHIEFDHLNGIEIQYTGTGSACVLTLNTLTNVLTTDVSGATEDNLDIDLSEVATGAELRDAIIATGVYTATTEMATNNWRPEHLDNITAQDIKTTTYMMLLNAAELYTYEILDAKNDLENKIRVYVPEYECTAFMYSHGDSSELARSYVAQGGFVGARGLTEGTTDKLTSMNKYNVKTIHAGALVGTVSENPTEAEVKQRVLAWIEYLRWYGAYGVIMAHAFSAESGFDNDVPIEVWGWIIEALDQSNIKSITFSDAMRTIAEHAESTSGTGGELAYLRTEAGLGDVLNIKLRSDALTINAGIFITGVNDTGEPDPWGNYVYRLPNIGADQGAGLPGTPKVFPVGR